MPKYDEAAEMAQPGAGPNGAMPDSPEEGAEQSSERTLFVSPDYLDGLDPESVKPGDILQFKVVGKDANGEIEVEYQKGGGDGMGMKAGKDWKSDLKETMTGGSEAAPGGY